LSGMATVLYETGLRPDECHRLDWADITFARGRHESQSGPSITMGGDWEASGGLDMACSNKKRPH
jgi:integrase